MLRMRFGYLTPDISYAVSESKANHSVKRRSPSQVSQMEAVEYVAVLQDIDG